MSQLQHLSSYEVPSPAAIIRFKQLFKAHFHRELSDKQAEDLARRFLQFVTLVLQNEAHIINEPLTNEAIEETI